MNETDLANTDLPGRDSAKSPNWCGVGGVTLPCPAFAEENTLGRAQAGDHHAFAQLYSKHAKHIKSVCLRMVGNIAEAEDLTQETFLQLHRKFSTYRGDSAFSTWLHRVAVNVVLMYMRKKRLSLTSLEEVTQPKEEEPGRSFGRPDLSLTGVVDRLALQQAAAELPKGYKLIFILHDVEGYEHKEIAGMLECSIGNSKSQLHKARRRLRDALGTPSPMRDKDDPVFGKE